MAPDTPPAPTEAAPEAPAPPASGTGGTGDNGALSTPETESTEPPSVHASEESAAASPASESEEAAPKSKRKRRRRRKKKPAEAAAPESEAKPSKARHRPATDRAPFQVGEEVFGRVTSVLDTAIMVDLSGKALAIFDRSEMEADDLVPAIGDRFVARVHQDGSRGGLVVLTRKPLREEESKPRVEQAAKEGALVKGLITGVIKGGIEVDIEGIRAFAPASGMDLHPQNANFQTLVGQVLDFKVVTYEKAGRDVVVSRRPMLEAEAHERRKKALELLQEGQVMEGHVRTVVEWGAFVALPAAENLEGLVHVSEASHDPRARLDDIFKAGETVEVKIIKIDDRGKIWLSKKALVADPWAEARAKYPAGSRAKGRVKHLERFGVFVELEPGVEGLLHVSDLTFKRVEHPKEIVNEGDEIDVVVAHFDTRNHKIALHPAPSGEQANEAPQRVAKNAILKAEVIKGESAGVLVRILGVTGRAARGFIPAGHTGTVRGTDLRKKFKPGSVIEAKVMELDMRRGEPKLSIRVAAEDEERRAHREYRQKLAKEASFGTLGDLLANKLK